ncbi:hypothetical protein PSHT_12079 [Puccinia striiformis]|uniref:Tet-like 2OG-Fe(II) oxygenase domain-containing protein n=1 Tax=Puccinia striiformis TaxID=27350 RepID=A0A2S4UZ20_9BASI|nr:hypothetical protein PSHT_12079 [Puccinia striiformis]
MPIIKLSPASIKRYCAGTPDSPQVLVCPACPGESHDPLDCVDYIRLRCPMISPEGSVMGTIDKDLLGKKDVPVAAPLLNKQQRRYRQHKAQNQANKRIEANIKYTNEAHITSHICRNDPEGKIRFFRNSFVAWRDNSRKFTVAILITWSLNLLFKIPINLMDAISGKMFSLGWRKGYEEDTTIATTGIAEKVSQDRLGYEDLQTHVPTLDTFISERFQNLSQPLYDKVKEQFLTLNAPGLAPYFEENTDGFTCHLSFTLGNFSNASHTDHDASPYTFVTWLPINEKTGDLIEDKLEVTGGQFVFPRNGFGIDFTGFCGVVECAWKANFYHHLTLPSTSSPLSFHTRLGYSCQLPQKTHNALQRIQNGFYDKPEYKDWRPRDMVPKKRKR